MQHQLNSGFDIALKDFMRLSRDRKKHKISDELSSANLHIPHIFSCRGYIFLGSLMFIIFYWVIPAWLDRELSTLGHSTTRPIAETLLIRRIYWIQIAGITLGLMCILFAMRNYFSTVSIKRAIRKSIINFFSRLFSKLKN